MSIQFGRWNFDGRPIEPDYLDKAEFCIGSYHQDGRGLHTESGLSILYGAFHTTKESRREIQPHITRSGAVITWDGRLDNRPDLTQQLKGAVSAEPTDVEIVAAAYEVWGTDCLARLLGDWAVVIWNSKDHSLTLAKDFAGTRHLYYAIGRDHITWSTTLEPLVLLDPGPIGINDEYIAGWFSLFPATHLTPYLGIDSVPPSSFVRVVPGGSRVMRYWDFVPGSELHCRSDAEFEETFRSLLTQSVKRRLHSEFPVLAELSGGIDSSSIVCVADDIVTKGLAETPRIDTISYFKNGEPDWNEQPYFALIEKKRGRIGCHIDISSLGSNSFQLDSDDLQIMPGTGKTASPVAGQFADCIAAQGNRVLLSGIGGDEVTGGIPMATPELADLLAAFQVRRLIHQLKAWALNMRKPWIHLLIETINEFLPPALVGTPKQLRPAPWLTPNLVGRQYAALTGYTRRLRFFGRAPSFQVNLFALDVLRRQLHSDRPSQQPTYDRCYPYLDRDLLEFLFAVPREQLLRPGQRRSLMRRALAGIVPDELLNRKRKAYITREPFAVIMSEWAALTEISKHMINSELGIVDSEAFNDALCKARQGQTVPMVPLIRTFAIEIWLMSLRKHGLLASATTEMTDSPHSRQMISAEKDSRRKEVITDEIRQT